MKEQCLDAPQLYDHSNYQYLEWPGTQYEQNYIAPFLSSPSSNYVSNVKTKMCVLKMGEQLFPLTVNDAEYDNSYVTSPFTMYITYGKQELRFLNNQLLSQLLSIPLASLGTLLKTSDINRVACVNNWLLSTNLYPNLENISLKKLTCHLIERFPQHAIMFRSLNRHTNAALMDSLQECGYLFVPSREVFIFDKKLKDYAHRRVTQQDFDLLKTTPYQILSHEDITEKDYERIVELYYLLYIDKYSDCNPKFTPAFIKLCHQQKLMNFHGLRGVDGHLVGIITSFNRNGILATPIVGYDTQLSPKEGLYRMLTALSLQESLNKGLVFNMSAGVSEFKKWRGGVGFIEYSALYCQHLPFYRRVPWNILHFLMTRIAIPMLHRYKF